MFSKEAHLSRAEISIHIGRGIVVNAQRRSFRGSTWPSMRPPSVWPSSCAGTSGGCATIMRKAREPAGAGERAMDYVLAPIDEESRDGGAEEADAEAGADGAPAVIAEMSTELPSLTVGEAVMRMDLADAPVLLFRNRSHGELNLVYRRADGNIGWIDPELDATRRTASRAIRRDDQRCQRSADPVSLNARRAQSRHCAPERNLSNARGVERMEIADLITPRSVVAQLRATNKKQALQELAKRAAAMSGIHERTIYDVLIERERLGSTGIGMGVGIPHGKLPGLDEALWDLRPARAADPVRRNRRSAGRPDFSAAGPGRRRRRSSEGAGPGVAVVARPHRLRKAARHRQRRRALRPSDRSPPPTPPRPPAQRSCTRSVHAQRLEVVLAHRREGDRRDRAARRSACRPRRVPRSR